MILLNHQPLTEPQIKALQSLLKGSPDNQAADLLFSVLRSRVAESQVKAAKALTDAVIFPKMLEDAETEAREASVAGLALSLLEGLRDGVHKGGEQLEYYTLKMTI